MKKTTNFLISIISIGFFFAPLAQAQLKMPTNEGIEAIIGTYFADAPDMLAIAKCESGAKQYRADGSVVRGGTGGKYIGIFQLSEAYAQTASIYGMDIYTPEGNIGYARIMYNKSDTVPWASCLKNVPVTVPTPTPPAVTTTTTATATSSTETQMTTPAPQPAPVTFTISGNLQFGIISPEVQALQKLLNSIGFPVAGSGPGSPGNETTKFGQLTKEAVQKFQCAKGIACSGSESTNGYGRVGPKTRAALVQAAQ